MDKSDFFGLKLEELMKIFNMSESEVIERLLQEFNELQEGSLMKVCIPMLVQNQSKRDPDRVKPKHSFESDIEKLYKILDMSKEDIIKEFTEAVNTLSGGALIKENIPVLVSAYLKKKYKSKYRKGNLKIKLEGCKINIKTKNREERKVLKLFNNFLKPFKQEKTEN